MPMMTPEQLQVSRVEWEAWQVVCKAMKACGGVTEDDLTARANRNETPGDKAMIAIREWGERLADLRIAYRNED